MNKRWYIENGNQGDVVLSTRIRLARNLEDTPFPARLDAAGRRKATERIRAALESIMPDLRYIDMTKLPRLEAISLAERHLISPEFAGGAEGSALLLREDESVSVMLCEEDHIRLQVLRPGLELQEAYDTADKLDSALGRQMKFAFDERLGYLTQCPTNLGTAMRASVMLHLPALTATGRVSRLAEGISKLGLTIRGAFGEGSEASGAVYQLSNQITLGIAESAAIENLQAITLQIADQERRAAAELLRQPGPEDQVWRALGVLRTARRLDSKEAAELLSRVRLGAVRNLLPVAVETVNELMNNVQPATLSLQNAADDGAEGAASGQRDARRADLVRKQLEQPKE
ncbi:MAG: protein arginine kinase [Oscillospiraceae bacterium]|jgi:protein arginine kinase|nr:protein arginine kinase [Oscillospiraceae bacterium]